MKKKLWALIILSISLFLGGNAMAENALNAKQQSIATVASYAARGNQEGLKQALVSGLESGVTVSVPTEGASNEWLEPVSDEEYNELP